MKTTCLFVLLLTFSTSFNLNAQQKCDNYACMIQRARDYKAAGDFVEAFHAINAAMRYPDANKWEADALLTSVFFEINQLRTDAEIATQKANEATQKAIEEREKAIKAEIAAVRLHRIAVRARDSMETLAQKGRELERTFSDSSAFPYLRQTGLEHFLFDTLRQSRDYRNALTYFALARFLMPDPQLDFLIEACQIGIEAEDDFIAGRLDSAAARYALVLSKVDSAACSGGFEQWRMAQIREVQELYEQLVQKQRSNPLRFIVLKGNWWTLPISFAANRDLQQVVFRQNPSNFKKLPTVLDSLKNLQSLQWSDCPNIREMTDWMGVRQLKRLEFDQNANLYALKNLDSIPDLSALILRNCPALTLVIGSSKLDTLAVEYSPQVRVAGLLAKNAGLQQLILADLPDDSLNISNLSQLESLSLARMKAGNLHGLENNTRLRELKVEALENLHHLKAPPSLRAGYISQCPALTDLKDWPASDTLKTLVLKNNQQLKTLPNWKNFPRLNTLIVQNERDLKRAPGTAALPHDARIYLLNNPNLITNSLHAGFGFDWDVRISSIKMEFEHRRRLQWRFVKNQDFGIKAIASYTWKNFYNPSPGIVKNASEGLVVGGVVSYYSPYLIYTGIGMGAARLWSRFSDESVKMTNHFVWINNLGVQVAPYFLRKDKMGLNMDLYTIFRGNDYFILPSFGLTYYRTLGFHRKTSFVRLNEARRTTFFKGKKVPQDALQKHVMDKN
ncbi:MAG: hypothetical protein SFV22_11220 [Saprospiraceae bacterium]|nr:hypothetical protein [Saprospiraceae bacterium]